MTAIPGVLPGDPHDARLLERVRPAGWENPEPAKRYDLAVVGGGTAGLVAAAIAAGLGAKVALVERRLLGGDCLNWGCVPSKALLAAAKEARGAVDPAGPDPAAFVRAMERMRRLRAEIAAHDSAERFAGLGVDVFLAEGRFVAPDRLEADGRAIAFRRAVIATGARPVTPPIEGLADAGFRTNETLLELEALPARVAVVGAGPVGCEIAQALARFGARVALLEAGDRILPADHPDAAAVVARALEADGVDLRTGWAVERVERAPEGARALRGGGGASIEVDEVVVAVGRAPNVEGLGLEAAGVEHGAEGVRVDDRLRTTNRRIWAAGDVLPGPRFTHVSDAQARIAVRNALFPGSRKASALVIPWVTFTDPELAHVGHTAASAGEAGIEIDAWTIPFEEVDRAVLEGRTEGFARVFTRKGGDEIVGATVVGARAGDVIGEVALAIDRGAGLGDLSGVVHSYPTYAEVLGRLGDRIQRTRLTPLAKRAIGWWLSWTR